MSVYQEAYHLPEFTYDYEKLKIEQRGPVYICSFNDADNLNAMSYAQMAEFNDFLIKVRMDKDCRVIVLTGEGRSFVAGADIGEQSTMDVAAGRKWGQRGSALFRRIEKLEIPTIDGKVKYTLPEGTQSGTTFRLKGKGIPSINGRGRGDQYVTVYIETPKNLNKEQKEALKKFAETMGESNYEEQKKFFKKFKK